MRPIELFVKWQRTHIYSFDEADSVRAIDSDKSMQMHRVGTHLWGQSDLRVAG